MTWLDEIKGNIGMAVNGIAFNIELSGLCKLRCASCGTGSFREKRKDVNMSIELFRKILDKAQSECKIRHIQTYMYSDSSYHPLLHEFIQECTNRGIRSKISTMLQRTNCDWEKVVEARPSELRISFPGLEKMSFYQGGAQPEEFMRNIEKVCSLPRHPETLWAMAMHVYNSNTHEIPLAEELAKKYSLKLVKIPAIMMVLEKTVRKNYSERDEEIMSHMLERPEVAVGRMKDSNYCVNWKQVSIDAEGMVRLCQLVYLDEFKLKPFLETPLRELQDLQRNHPFCGECIAAKAHRLQECFRDFENPDPIGEADRKRRKDKNYRPEINLEGE